MYNILEWNIVAIKLESCYNEYQTLQHEFQVLKTLGGYMGLPTIYWFATEGGYNAMVFNCLGLSFKQLFAHTNYKFSNRTIPNLALQLVSLIGLCVYVIYLHTMQIYHLQHIHSCNFIHCDLKLSNILMFIQCWVSTVHIIDFGLSKKFRSPDTHLLFPIHQGSGHGFTGTLLFVSNNSHSGCKLGKWDDLKSLAYIWIYFLCGGLPS